MSKSDLAVEIIAAQRPRVRLMGVLYEKKSLQSFIRNKSIFFQKYVSLIKNSSLKRDAYILIPE